MKNLTAIISQVISISGRMTHAIADAVEEAKEPTKAFAKEVVHAVKEVKDSISANQDFQDLAVERVSGVVDEVKDAIAEAQAECAEGKQDAA